MRVIAGKARSMPLKTIPGMDTRPTTDRTKETLFNMLQPSLADCSFLDLFSGSGAIGIEALSRGAGKCIFVEQSDKAVSCIRDNLKFTRLEDGAEIIKSDVFTALRKLEEKETFDCVFMDPPYDKNLEKEVLFYLASSKLLAEDAVVVVEASLKTKFDYAQEYGFEMTKYKKYKTNAHVFFKKAQD